jgi:hypothetical protein
MNPLIAALIEVDGETGLVTWVPHEIVLPLLVVAGLAIGVGIVAWLFFKGLFAVLRYLEYFVAGSPPWTRDPSSERWQKEYRKRKYDVDDEMGPFPKY